MDFLSLQGRAYGAGGVPVAALAQPTALRHESLDGSVPSGFLATMASPIRPSQVASTLKKNTTLRVRSSNRSPTESQLNNVNTLVKNAQELFAE